MRKTWLGPLGLLVIVVACGETGKRSPPTNIPPSGGEGGERAQPSAGDAGAIEPGLSGGAAGEAVGGAEPLEPMAGAGGEAPEPLPGYSLTFVPPFEPPAGSTPPAEGTLTEIRLLGMSRDGTRLFGAMYVAYGAEDRDELLTWTAASGSVRVPLPKLSSSYAAPSQLCVADDGSGAFFTRSLDEQSDAFHWTAQEGAVALPAIVGLVGSAASCNATATRAAFMLNSSTNDTQELRIWQSGQNSDAAEVVAWPLAEQERGTFTLSLQGEKGLINAFTADSKTRPYSWSAADGPVDLGVPSDDCRGELISQDGSTIVGGCGSSAFRWTTQDGYAALGSISPYFLSEDGQTLWGMRFFAGQPKTELVVVGPGKSSAQTIALPKGNERFVLTSATADGKTVYLNLNPVGGPRRAARYQLDGELEPLDLVPGYAQSSVSGISSDGSLAIGAVTQDELDFGRAVIWDAQGARDVLEELQQGHVDVSRISNMRIDGIWVGAETLRVAGSCQVDEQTYQIFFAELPLR